MMLTLKEINTKKTEYQKIGFQVWKEAGARGAFVNATATGKTHLATHYAIPTMNKIKPEYKTIVVVPKKFLKEDWEGIGNKTGHIKKNKLKNVEVWVINSFVRMRHQCQLLIIDEAHRATNEDAQFFNKVLEVCPAPYIMCLTATLTKSQKDFLFQRKIPIVQTITTRQAEVEGLISPYRVYNLAIKLTDKDREVERELHEQFIKYSSKFDRNMDLAIRCSSSTNPRWNPELNEWVEPPSVKYAREMGWSGISLEKAKSNYLRRKNVSHGQKGNISIWEDEIDDFEFTPTKIQIYASQYLRYMNKRKDYLHNAFQKLEITKQIFKKFNVSTIIFSQRTQFADRITNLLGEKICASYHSKMEPKSMNDAFGKPIKYGKSASKAGEIKLFGINSIKKFNMQAFEEKKIKALSTATTLEEGFNVEGIELGIITSGTSTERANTQKIGRVVRAQEGKVAVIVNLYVKDSQDEVWLRKRQIADKPPLWIDSIDEITFGNEKQNIILKNENS